MSAARTHTHEHSTHDHHLCGNCCRWHMHTYIHKAQVARKMEERNLKFPSGDSLSLSCIHADTPHQSFAVAQLLFAHLVSVPPNNEPQISDCSCSCNCNGRFFGKVSAKARRRRRRNQMWRRDDAVPAKHPRDFCRCRVEQAVILVRVVAHARTLARTAPPTRLFAQPTNRPLLTGGTGTLTRR